MSDERKVDVLGILDAAAETCERYGHKASALALPKARAAVVELIEELKSIRLYANDTLSGPIDPENNTREWYREAVVELRNRARDALAALGATP